MRFFYLFIFSIILTLNSSGQTNISIIPKPDSYSLGTDSFTLKSGAKIHFDTKVKNGQLAAIYFINRVAKSTGYKLSFDKMPDPDVKGDVNIQFDKTITNDEGYTLDISKKYVIIKAKTGAGAFYAFQSLLQLFSPEIYSDKKLTGREWKVPAATINDGPRFKYRGMHLDCSRHLFNIDFIKRYIDLMAIHKMNTFHWHLTDDQGWRIEIKKYPKLTTVGAYRKETCSPNATSSTNVCDGIRYGGYYSQAQIKEIVKYASDRFITVIPEIEMPGHSVAALSAYPWLACMDSSYQPRTTWGVSDDVMCPSEKTFQFIEDVLTEVLQLFPGKYIHIGGDEVPKIRWKESKLCQDIIHKEKLRNEEELQGWFNKRVEKFLNSRNRQIIGWDEILEGGVSSNATIMSWRGSAGGKAAALTGHDAVMTPGGYCYFDHYQSLALGEPFAFNGFTTVEKVYSFEPIPEGLTDSQAVHIIGAQGNLWTEYIQFPKHAEYMAFPRMAALCEVVWSKKGSKNYDDFLNRLTELFKRYDVLKINYAKHVIDVKGVISKGNNGLPLVTLSSRVEGAEIFYSTDGTEVTQNSEKYNAPFEINKACTVKAASFKNNLKLGNDYAQPLIVHKAIGANVSLTYEPAQQYNPGSTFFLVNGIEGSYNYGDGQWLGFSGKNMEALLELSSETEISKLKMNFNVKNESWIYAPRSLKVLVSNDGLNFTEVFNDTALASTMNLRSNPFEANFEKVNARFIKVIAENTPAIPDGLPGSGNPAWLFVDELEVE